MFVLGTRVSPLDDSSRNDSAIDTADRVSNANESNVVSYYFDGRYQIPYNQIRYNGVHLIEDGTKIVNI